DLRRVTDGRADPQLARVLVNESWPTIEWLRDVGIKFRLLYERQSYLAGDVEQFWGGLAIGTVDGGKGLVAQHFDTASRAGIEMRFDHCLLELAPVGGGIVAECEHAGRIRRLTARNVVVAAGGFEADADRREEH